MNILITGGAGFIGSNLTERLLGDGYIITVLDNFNSYYKPEHKRENVKSFLNNPNYVLIEGDITDKNLLESLFKKEKFDKVVHLAASVGVRNSLKYPEEYIRNNIDGTKNILDTVGNHGTRHFLFASSSSIYGNDSTSPFEEDKVIGSDLSPYAQTKKDGETLCFNHRKNFNTNITIFRFFTVYGPKGRPDMSPYIFTESILKNKKISIFGDGSAKRDFTNIADLVSGIVLGIQKEFPYEIFNLGTSSPISVKNFIEKIETITGQKADLEYKERFLPEMKNTYANIQKAQDLFGYKPKVDIMEGLEIFINWFKKNRM